MLALMLRALRSLALALLAALVVSLATLERVDAQSSGGSFGGGDWGGGGGGGGSWGGGGGSWGGGGGSWGGGRSWSRGVDDDRYESFGGYSTGSGGGLSCGGACCLLAFVGLLLVAIVILGRRRGGSGGMTFAGHPGASPGPGGMRGSYTDKNAIYVTQIQLGLDWRARPHLQQHLQRLAETGDTRSRAGLAYLLGETVIALRRHEMSWLYAGYRDTGAWGPPQAQATFQQLANDARSRFQHELVRAYQGRVQQGSSPEMQAHAHEGQGTVVVTIVLATRRPMVGFAQPDAGQIRNALADRGSLSPDDLVALEVVWSPAAENDRMSTGELEQHYPELQLIDPKSIAGRVFCAYCQGPFPMELLNCPHCGAPAEASKHRREPPR
jgi:uncharacterized membrane protein